MSALVCSGCGKVTNTAVCNWIEPKVRPDGQAWECYLRVGEDGNWEKGCAWDKADPYYQKPLFEKYLGRKA